MKEIRILWNLKERKVRIREKHMLWCREDEYTGKQKEKEESKEFERTVKCNYNKKHKFCVTACCLWRCFTTFRTQLITTWCCSGLERDFQWYNCVLILLPINNKSFKKYGKISWHSNYSRQIYTVQVIIDELWYKFLLVHMQCYSIVYWSWKNSCNSHKKWQIISNTYTYIMYSSTFMELPNIIIVPLSIIGHNFHTSRCTTSIDNSFYCNRFLRISCFLLSSFWTPPAGAASPLGSLSRLALCRHWRRI